MNNFTPREIVSELDHYIVGQNNAKRSVAIALRNRWRRQQVDPDLREEIAPKNIILIGPTGVGKTEISRRLSRFTDSPFMKVEASKFTEVGYVGRDVESMIRDLVEITVTLGKVRDQEQVRAKAWQIAEERMLDLLLPRSSATNPQSKENEPMPAPALENTPSPATREKLRKMLRDGKLNDRYVDLEVADKSMPMVEVFSNAGHAQYETNLRYDTAD